MAGILEEFLLVFKPTVRGSGFQTLNKQLQNTHKSLFSVKNLFRAFVGYDIYSGLKSMVTGLVDSSKELGAMTSRFYAITKSNKLANKELEWTFELAKRTAMPLKATADSYSIFYAATQKNLGTSGAREVFKDWTEVSRVLHLSEYQFERVTYALREMASKGAIYSQDLRMQIGTHVPNAMGLAKQAADDLGITGVNWFDTLQKRAKGNQQLISKFIYYFSKHAKETYASQEALAEALKKPDAQLNKLTNSWKELQYNIVKSGFEKDLVSFLSKLNILVGALADHAGALYKIVKSFVKLFLVFSGLKFVKFLTSSKYLRALGTTYRYWKKSLGVFRALGVVLKGGVLAGLVKMLAPGTLATLTWLFTTPPGWVMLGLMAIAGAVMWFKNRFPNAWLAMINILTSLYIKIFDLIHAIPFIGSSNKDHSGRAIQNKRKELEIGGGRMGNRNPQASEWYDVLNKASHATKNSSNFLPLVPGMGTPMALFNKFQQMTPRQQAFNIQVQNIINAGGSPEEVRKFIDDNNPAWVDTLMRKIKNNIKR